MLLLIYTSSFFQVMIWMESEIWKFMEDEVLWGERDMLFDDLLSLRGQ